MVRFSSFAVSISPKFSLSLKKGLHLLNRTVLYQFLKNWTELKSYCCKSSITASPVQSSMSLLSFLQGYPHLAWECAHCCQVQSAKQKALNLIQLKGVAKPWAIFVSACDWLTRCHSSWLLFQRLSGPAGHGLSVNRPLPCPKEWHAFIIWHSVQGMTRVHNLA